MAYSEIRKARYNYPNGDYFEFKGILTDEWGGGTLSRGQRINPASYDKDSAYMVYDYDNTGFWKILTKWRQAQ